MALVTPELLVQQLLSAGFDRVKQEPAIVRELFSVLSDDEIAEYITFLKKENIEVRLGRPPRGADLKLPLVVIEAAGEEEVAEQDVLNDVFYAELSNNGFTETTYQGVRMRATYNIYALGKDNRQARLMYRLLVAFLIIYSKDLEAAGFQNRRMSGNKDMEVSLSADPIEAKLLTLAGEYWFSVGLSQKLLDLDLYVTVSPVVTTYSSVIE